MRILFITTRPPYGRMTGHKVGLRTYVQALQAMGHTLIVASFAIPGDEVAPADYDLGAETHFLALPSRRRILGNILRQHLTNTLSLNECLYVCPAAAEHINQLIDRCAIDFVFVDMIRTARYGQQAKRPWMLDHDDLLSERYTAWASKEGSEQKAILGYLEAVIPKSMHAPTRWIFRRLLRREARILAKREVYWTQQAPASSLRTEQEVTLLRRHLPSAQVYRMSVSVPIPPRTAGELARRPMDCVFIGGLTYQPNLDALIAYVRDIVPAFERMNITVPTLKIIGAAPAELRQQVMHPRLQFLGYVPDVTAELQAAQCLFAPIVSGTGVKIKVLDALAAGVPVIGYPMGLSGIDGQPGRDFLLAETANEFVQCFKRLRDDPEFAVGVGVAGRALAIRQHSLDAAVNVLRPELDKAFRRLGLASTGLVSPDVASPGLASPGLASPGLA